MTSRRGFITGLISLVAAPAIVRVGSIMPVKVMVDYPELVDGRPPTLGEWLDQMVLAQRRHCAAVGLPYPPVPRVEFRPLFPAIDLKNEILDDLVYEASPGA